MQLFGAESNKKIKFLSALDHKGPGLTPCTVHCEHAEWHTLPCNNDGWSCNGHSLYCTKLYEPILLKPCMCKWWHIAELLSRFQLVKKFSRFVGPEVSVPCSPKLAAGPHMKQFQCCLPSYVIFICDQSLPFVARSSCYLPWIKYFCLRIRLYEKL
jgi:hypothetical protein